MISAEQVKKLRDEGKSIPQIAKDLSVSESTVKRRLRESVKNVYPRYQSARIVREVPNRRLVHVEYDGITRIAIKLPNYSYRPKQEVTLELMDEKTCKVL